MISVHSCRNKLFKARNWIWRGRGLGWGKREIQKQRWREERGGWNQPIWKRRDRKSLWQPSIMRFSLCGFLFTWKGINIKNAHHSPVYSHLFKLSLLHIHPSHSQWVLHLVNNHLTVYCKWSLFTWFQRQQDKNVSETCDQVICFNTNVRAAYSNRMSLDVFATNAILV